MGVIVAMWHRFVGPLCFSGSSSKRSIWNKVKFRIGMAFSVGSIGRPFGSAVISVCRHAAAVSMPSPAGAVVWRGECVPQAAGVTGREPEAGTTVRGAAMFCSCRVTPSVAVTLSERLQESGDFVGLGD